MQVRSELVVVSDIHLREPGDERSQLLEQLISRLSPGDVRFLVLLGDIFDFCLGSSEYFRKKFAPLGELLEQVSRRGIQVLFFEGNHEFEMERIGWKGVEFVTDPYRVLRLRDGKRVALAHGDLVHSSWDYRIFRKVVKSQTVSEIARFVPGRLIELYAFSHAKISRARDDYRKLDHEKLLNSAEEWVRRSACDFGIFGHFHVPYAETRHNHDRSHPVRLFSLDSWDHPNTLTYDAGVFNRGFLSLAKEKESWEEARSLGEKLSRKNQKKNTGMTEAKA